MKTRINKIQRAIRKGKAFLGASLMAASIFSGCENPSPIITETAHYIIEETEDIGLCEDSSKVFRIGINRAGKLFGTQDFSIYPMGSDSARIVNGTLELKDINLGVGAYSIRVRDEVEIKRGHYIEVCETSPDYIKVAFADNELYDNVLVCFPRNEGDSETIKNGEYKVILTKDSVRVENDRGLKWDYNIQRNSISQEITILEENYHLWILAPAENVSCTTKSGGIGTMSVVSIPHDMDNHEI